MALVTKTYFVLKFDTYVRASLFPLDVEIVALLQSEEPNKSANNNDTDGIYEERIVENHEANCDMVFLDDGCDRNRKCDQERNS